MSKVRQAEMSLRTFLQGSISTWGLAHRDHPSASMVTEYYSTMIESIKIPDDEEAKNARIDSSLGLLELAVPREDHEV